MFAGLHDSRNGYVIEDKNGGYYSVTYTLGENENLKFELLVDWSADNSYEEHLTEFGLMKGQTFEFCYSGGCILVNFSNGSRIVFSVDDGLVASLLSPNGDVVLAYRKDFDFYESNHNIQYCTEQIGKVI